MFVSLVLICTLLFPPPGTNAANSSAVQGAVDTAGNAGTPSSVNAPQCQQLQLQLPELSKNLQFNGECPCSTNNCDSGASCNFTCGTGFTIKNTATIMCQANGSWTASPKCKSIKCLKPQKEFLQVNCNCVVGGRHRCKYNTTCGFICSTGHKLTGATTSSTCTESGWSPGVPQCEAITCDKPQPSNMLVTCRCNAGKCLYGTVCYFACSTGSRLIGTITSSTCKEFGWSRGVPQCEAITCPALQASANMDPVTCGKSCNGDSCSYGTTCTFGCFHGYKLSPDTSTTTCGNPSWSQSVPSCVEITCAKPFGSNMQSVSCSPKCNDNSCLFGATCTFSCANPDYRLVGSATVTCDSSNNWSPSIPTCKYAWTRSSTCEYLVSTEVTTNVNAAANFCAEKQATLAILSSTSKFSTVTRLRLLTSGWHFVGLSKATGIWTWNDTLPETRTVYDFTGESGRKCAVLSNTGALYASKCSQFTAKALCERKVSSSATCPSSGCENGGTCHLLGCSYTCTCTNYFHGPRCTLRTLVITTADQLDVPKGRTGTVDVDVQNPLREKVTCRIEKDSTRLYIWSAISDSRKLTYETPAMLSSATYVVICSIPAISVTEQRRIFINVLEGGYGTVSASTLTVYTTDVLVCAVECIPHGNPLPAASWKRPNGGIIGSTGRVSQAKRGQTACLKFSRPLFRDAGEYKCTATISGKTNIVTTVVTVLGEPTEVPSPSVVYPSGYNVVMSCAFNGRPKPTVIWKFSNGTDLPNTSQYKITGYSNYTYQTTAVLSVYGTLCEGTSQQKFKCFANNSLVPTPVASGEYTITPSVKYPSFWISSSSPWADLNSPSTKCTAVRYSGSRFLKGSNTIYRPVCEMPPVAPSSAATVTLDDCEGTVIHVSWEIKPEAASFPHKVFFNNRSKIVPLGQNSTTIYSLTVGKLYKIAVMPLYEGCQRSKPPLKYPVTPIHITLQAPKPRIRIRNQKCVVAWLGYVSDKNVGSFQVQYSEKPRAQRPNSTYAVTAGPAAAIGANATRYSIENLSPNTEYLVQVSALPHAKCAGKVQAAVSDFTNGSCKTSVAGPSSVPLPPAPATFANGAPFQLAPVSERNGLISCYLLVVLKVVNGSGNSTALNVTQLKQGSDKVQDGEHYVAHARAWFGTTASITIGDDAASCCDPSSATLPGGCSAQNRQRRAAAPGVITGQNRPLQTGAPYQYYAMTSSPGGNGPIYTASPMSQPVISTAPPTTQPDSSSAGLYAGVAIVVLILLVLIVLVVIYRRPIQQRMRPHKSDQPTKSRNGQPIGMLQRHTAPEDSFEGEDEVGFDQFAIGADSLLDTYLDKSANENLVFRHEFKEVLPGLVANANVSTEYGKLAQPLGKNRFKNILPSDNGRVVLSKINHEENSDYINASYVNGYSVSAKFIAAQGPLRTTCGDFWRMVTENDCRVIVMLTQLTEAYKVKCYQYWPSVGATAQFGSCNVTTTHESSSGDVVSRILRVTNEQTQTPLEIRHFQYLGWPDHGIPHATSPIIRLHTMAKEAQAGHTGPMVVHCSAGVGRTGTFIALDVLSEQLMAEGQINVFEAVYNMRLNRTEMVQSVAQYALVHKLIAELQVMGDTECEASDFPRHVQRLKVVDRVSRVSGLQVQFDVIGRIPPSLSETKSGGKAVNRDFNNDPSILPYDHTLPYVGMFSSDNEIPYVNASNIQAYNHGLYYVVAQHPPKNNLNSFWRCVFDNHIRCIVMLGGETSCGKYWDSPEMPEFHVKTTSTTQHTGYFERNLDVTRDPVTRGDPPEKLSVVQLVMKEWTSDDATPDPAVLLDVLSKVERFQVDAVEERGKKYIALIHCSNGSSRTGVICGVANCLERLRSENRVDVVREVKDLRECRAGMVGNVGLYAYCHQVLLEYVKSFDLYGNFK